MAMIHKTKILAIVHAIMLIVVFGACISNKNRVSEITSDDALGYSEVYVAKRVSSQNLLGIFEVLDKEFGGRVAIKLPASKDDSLLNRELISLLVKKTGGVLIEKSSQNDSINRLFVNYWKNSCNQTFKIDLIDIESEMKIPVCDTTVIKYFFVGEHLAYYDFLIAIGILDKQSENGFGGVLQSTSLGIVSTSGKTIVCEGGPKAMAIASKAVCDYFLGGQNVVYIMLMGMKDYGILASKNPVALDKACADIILANVDSIQKNSGYLKGLRTIEWAERIGLGSKKYKLVEID